MPVCAHMQVPRMTACIKVSACAHAQTCVCTWWSCVAVCMHLSVPMHVCTHVQAYEHISGHSWPCPYMHTCVRRCVCPQECVGGSIEERAGRKWVPALPYLSGQDKGASSEVREGEGRGCEQMGPCLDGAGDRNRPCVQLRILLDPRGGIGCL